MMRYRAYGLVIESDLELTSLTEFASGDTADVTVSLGHLDDSDLECTPDGQRIGAYFSDVARFLLEGGRRVTVDVRRDVGDEVIEARLLGEIFAGLLRQRGHLVLHASAVARGGASMAFLGESGWGKSTLAEAFCQRGYTLLTDDVMAVSFDGEGRPLVIPSYSQIRLREDSASHLVPHGDGMVDISRNGPKKARPYWPLSETSVPLEALYLLEPVYREASGVVPVSAQTALMSLVSHTRARTLVGTNAPVLLRDHLHQCARLIRWAPPRGLERQRGFGLIDELVSRIEQDAFGEAVVASRS